jgi:hypothetical protein
MLRFGQEPLPPVADNRSGDGAPGALRPRPVRMEPGGAAAVVMAARWPPGTRIRRSVPAAHPSSRRVPAAATGSVIVQQQALRDLHAAWAGWYSALTQWRSRTAKLPPEERPSPPSPPSRRKRNVNEGFRVVATGPRDARRLDRRRGEVLVPKLGWVRFRWSRPVPDAKSYRVTRDHAGHWHIAFAAIPPAIPGTGRARLSASTGAWPSRRPCRPGSCSPSRACAPRSDGASSAMCGL